MACDMDSHASERFEVDLERRTPKLVGFRSLLGRVSNCQIAFDPVGASVRLYVARLLSRPRDTGCGIVETQQGPSSGRQVVKAVAKDSRHHRWHVRARRERITVFRIGTVEKVGVFDVVRASVNDASRFHSTSIHACYRRAFLDTHRPFRCCPSLTWALVVL